MKNEIQSGVTGDESKRNEDANAKQFLTFKVEKEEYGVSLMTIREIKGWSTPTQLPNSPSFMKGVINLRGVVIPIFDLRHRFDMGVTDANEKNVVIIISIKEKLIGVLVDAVSDILTVTEDQIKPAPKVDSKIDDSYVDGLIQSDDKMVVILNIDNLFDPETLDKIEKAEKSAKKINQEKKQNSPEAENNGEENAEENNF